MRARSAEPRAQAFYRALEALGARAADEALLALRLVLAGRAPDDDAVRALRDAVAQIRAGAPEGRAAYEALTAAP